eukprot:g5363.t1
MPRHHNIAWILCVAVPLCSLGRGADGRLDQRQKKLEAFTSSLPHGISNDDSLGKDIEAKTQDDMLDDPTGVPASSRAFENCMEAMRLYVRDVRRDSKVVFRDKEDTKGKSESTTTERDPGEHSPHHQNGAVEKEAVPHLSRTDSTSSTISALTDDSSEEYQESYTRDDEFRAEVVCNDLKQLCIDAPAQVDQTACFDNMAHHFESSDGVMRGFVTPHERKSNGERRKDAAIIVFSLSTSVFVVNVVVLHALFWPAAILVTGAQIGKFVIELGTNEESHVPAHMVATANDERNAGSSHSNAGVGELALRSVLSVAALVDPTHTLELAEIAHLGTRPFFEVYSGGQTKALQDCAESMQACGRRPSDMREGLAASETSIGSEKKRKRGDETVDGHKASIVQLSASDDEDTVGMHGTFCAIKPWFKHYVRPSDFEAFDTHDEGVGGWDEADDVTVDSRASTVPFVLPQYSGRNLRGGDDDSTVDTRASTVKA